MPFLKTNAALLTFVLAVLDGCFVLGGFLLACRLGNAQDSLFTLQEYISSHMPHFIVFVIAWCAVASDQRLFASRRNDRMEEHIADVAKAWVYSFGFSALVIAFFSKAGLDRTFLPWFGGTSLLGLVLFRMALRLFLWSIRRRGFNFRHVIIVGTNKRAKRLVQVMTSEERFGYHIVGIVDDDADRMSVFGDMPLTHLGKCCDLDSLLKTTIVDEVYLALPMRSYYEMIHEMTDLCENVGVTVRLIADFFPLKIAKSKVHLLEDVPLMSISAVPEAQLPLYVKRTIDLAGSLFGLVFIGSWLFPIIAVLIKIQSSGQVFFLQERVGLNGRRFNMIKFRSMVQDAEKLRQQLIELNEADGPVFKIRNDPRITPIGRFIRKTSIDELPQLFNVLIGDMSLVGPRPPIPSEVEEYHWNQRRRLSVKPGMTGLWQVSGRSDLSFKEWVELDLLYIDTWSIVQDFRILIRTISVVINRTGAS